MKQVLILKLGALGDVIRTSPLLRVLDGEVTWVTSAMAMPLLVGNSSIGRLLSIEDPGFRLDRKYDLVINLEDDLPLAKLASEAASGTVVGPYWNGSSVAYNGPSTEWFDMSLSSVYGREQADQLKLRNRKTYQEMVFSALGLRFQGQDPILNLSLEKSETSGLIGIEERAGGVWPTKRWTRYGELSSALESAGYHTKFFRQRDSVVEYADDINECEFVICGDTLAMHIALALGKKVVALFTCTSPWEIYGYGRLGKVISPLLESHFYKREYSAEPAKAIAVSDVEECFRALAEIAEPVRQMAAER